MPRSGLVRGLTSGLLGFKRGEREVEEERRQIDRDALARSIQEFNLEAAQGRERRAEAGEVRTQREETRKEFQAERQRRINEQVADALKASGMPDAVVEAARGGEFQGGDLVRLFRPDGAEGVTATTRFTQQSQAFRGLVDTARRRATARWRQMTTGPLGSLRAPRDERTGQPISLADLESQEMARLENERGLAPGTLAKAEISLASSGEFDLDMAPPEPPETGTSQPVPRAITEMVDRRLRLPPRPRGRVGTEAPGPVTSAGGVGAAPAPVATPAVAPTDDLRTRLQADIEEARSHGFSDEQILAELERGGYPQDIVQLAREILTR